MEDPLHKFKQSLPFNKFGDRLLLPGNPGALEKLVQLRERQTRIEAENRIRGMLEDQIPEALEVLTDEQLKTICALVRSLGDQWARQYFLDSLHVFREFITYVPTAGACPRSEDLGPVELLQNLQPQEDPLVQEAPETDRIPAASAGRS